MRLGFELKSSLCHTFHSAPKVKHCHSWPFRPCNITLTSASGWWKIDGFCLSLISYGLWRCLNEIAIAVRKIGRNSWQLTTVDSFQSVEFWKSNPWINDKNWFRSVPQQYLNSNMQNNDKRKRIVSQGFLHFKKYCYFGPFRYHGFLETSERQMFPLVKRSSQCFEFDLRGTCVSEGFFLHIYSPIYFAHRDLWLLLDMAWEY